MSERCSRCCFQVQLCLCDAIPRLAPRTRVVILRHHTERFRSSNSGRLAHLALDGSQLRDVFGPDRGEVTVSPGAWLVFPEGPPRTTAPVTPPAELVVLDATWHQARRMRQRIAALRGLPVLALAMPVAPSRMRRSPGPNQVSTIEAIAAALALVEDPALAGPLERLFQTACERARRTGRAIRTEPG